MKCLRHIMCRYDDTIDKMHAYLLSTLLRDGADNLTPFGIFLAISCTLTLFIKFFSRFVAVLSFKNKFKQVFDALPRFVFPGVNFNLYLITKQGFSQVPYRNIFKNNYL